MEILRGVRKHIDIIIKTNCILINKHFSISYEIINQSIPQLCLLHNIHCQIRQYCRCDVIYMMIVRDLRPTCLSVDF
jgi:hypothetical protein